MFQATALEAARPMREVIYLQIREAITTGVLKEGERLIESELAAQLKASRTPVREAIRMLESERLVESVPRRGVVVKGVSIDDIIEIYRIRQALEVMAFKAAAENIGPAQLSQARRYLDDSNRHLREKNFEVYYADNEAFTNVIVKACRMPRTIQLISSYRDHLRSFRKVTLSDPARQQEVICQHSDILSAIEAKDTERVSTLVFEHLEGALAVCKRYREGMVTK
ncbi:MAG: GntR family transcriptional regulator [Synergistaceae bacterium]|nr:GntR family transcriptional regulator [Synergistaceae bacterium]